MTTPRECGTRPTERRSPSRSRTRAACGSQRSARTVHAWSPRAMTARVWDAATGTPVTTACARRSVRTVRAWSPRAMTTPCVYGTCPPRPRNGRRVGAQSSCPEWQRSDVAASATASDARRCLRQEGNAALDAAEPSVPRRTPTCCEDAVTITAKLRLDPRFVRSG